MEHRQHLNLLSRSHSRALRKFESGHRCYPGHSGGSANSTSWASLYRD